MKKELFNHISTNKKITLTQLRKDILTILYEKNQPMGAYDILEKLKKKRTNAEPPTVYRVLKFLVQEKLIHRIESKNTYVCCSELMEEAAEHKAILLLCKKCHKSYEFRDKHIFLSILKFSTKYHLEVDDSLIEVTGTCQRCYS